MNLFILTLMILWAFLPPIILTKVVDESVYAKLKNYIIGYHFTTLCVMIVVLWTIRG